MSRQLLINDEEVELEQDETIATDYEIAPIGKIQTRTSSRSISFALPDTARNREVTQNAQQLNNQSNLPYTLIKARYYVDGIDQKIFFCEIASISDSIKIRLFGSNANFYAAIKARTMSDLDLSDLTHDWTLANVFGSRANTTGYIYPFIDYHSDSPNSLIDNTARQIDVRFMLFSLFFHDIINRIITGAGYTSAGNILTNSDYLSVLVAATTISPSDDYAETLMIEAETTGVQNPRFLAPKRYKIWPKFPNDIFNPLGLFATRAHFFGTTQDSYLVDHDGNYTFKIIVNVRSNSINHPLVITLERLRGVVVTTLSQVTHNPTTSSQLQATITLAPEEVALLEGDFVYLFMETNTSAAGGDFQVISGSFEVTDAELNDATFGRKMVVSSLVEDLKQSDYMKLFVQMFGQMIDVNEQDKIVNFKPFSLIIDNIPSYNDITSLIDKKRKTEITFKPSGYAQKNKCIYVDDDTVKKRPTTDSSIDVNNEVLTLSKNLFVSPFASSSQVVRMIGESMNQIKCWTDAGGVDQDFEERKPRILILEQRATTETFTWIDGSTSPVGSESQVGGNVPFTRFSNATFDFNLGWSYLLPRFSQDIIDMLTSYKMIKTFLRLDPAFINQLDHFIPVYIDEFNSYFYLNKIRQFKSTSRQSTKTELVKITNR